MSDDSGPLVHRDHPEPLAINTSVELYVMVVVFGDCSCGIVGVFYGSVLIGAVASQKRPGRQEE